MTDGPCGHKKSRSKQAVLVVVLQRAQDEEQKRRQTIAVPFDAKFQRSGSPAASGCRPSLVRIRDWVDPLEKIIKSLDQLPSSD